MIRVFAFLVSIFAIGSFIAADQADAAQKRGGGGGGGARPAAARVAAPRAAPRMATPRVHAAPRIAGPRAAPRYARPAQVAPRITREVRKQQITAPKTHQLASSPNKANAGDLRAQRLQAIKQQRLDRQQANIQTRIDRLQQRANNGKLSPAAQQQLQRLQARQQDLKQNAVQGAKLTDQQNLRPNGKPRITADAARQGRFAANFKKNPNWQARRANLIAARVAARQAWRHHRRAIFVAWFGPIFWPYVYSDIFDYTFWPYAYDDAYWAYIYDDFFDSVYWAGPPPYADDYYVGPYAGGYASAVPGRPRNRAVAQTVQQLCKEPGKGITAWPFERIDEAVRPNAEQRDLLEQVRAAAAKAAEDFKASCSEDIPMTSPGRLQAMINRLQATLNAVRTVRPPLERFYTSLTDEQKARFNAIGPDIGQEEARAARNETQGRGADGGNSCGGSKAGLTSLPIQAIEDAVKPTGDQQAALDRLNEATEKAVQTMQAACPDAIPLTPVGRLETMEQRLDAMVTAANTIRPALEDFYASLNNEQKARFNTLSSKQASR